MRNSILITFLISFFQITVASETEKFDVPSNYLVSYNLVKSHTTKTISELWKKHHIPKVILKVRNDVDI